MRSVPFIFIYLLLTGQAIAQQKTAFQFSISSLDKSMLFDRYTYYVTSKYLIIEHGPEVDFSFGKKPQKATVVLQIKLDSSDVLQLDTLASIVDNDSLKSNYHNLCIMDGLILDFNFTLGSKQKKLFLSNYYVSQMQPFVDFVNMKVPEEYKIWYDRLDLEKIMAKCTASKLLVY